MACLVAQLECTVTDSFSHTQYFQRQTVALDSIETLSLDFQIKCQLIIESIEKI